jgi:putative transposase
VKESKVISLEERAQDEAKSYLEELLSEGARKLLQTAIENEVVEYLEAHRERRTEAGQRTIVRNGHHPERELVTGIGPIKVRQPRIRHRDGQKFSSAILPAYMRRVASIDALIPALYLKGISTGDFTEALTAILGSGPADYRLPMSYDSKPAGKKNTAGYIKLPISWIKCPRASRSCQRADP